jgi:hypothetical protein
MLPRRKKIKELITHYAFCSKALRGVHYKQSKRQTRIDLLKESIPPVRFITHLL